MLEAIKIWIVNNQDLVISVCIILGMSLLYVGMLVVGILLIRGKNYVILEDEKSAIVGIYPLTLLDRDGYRMWVKKTETDTFVETVHDIYPIGNKLMITVYSATLHFSRSDRGIIVHWGDDVTRPLRASQM